MPVLDIVVDNSYSQLVDCIDPKIINKLSDACSFFKTGANFTPSYEKGDWDGRTRLFDCRAHTFPTGLCSRVIKVAEAQGYSVDINDTRVAPRRKYDVKWGYPYKLRPYQVSAVEDSQVNQRGVIKIATGGGKTVCAMRIAYELGVKCLFIVNTKEALYDTVKCFKECFPDLEPGIYGDQKKKLGDFMTIATMGSVSSRFTKGDKLFEEENYKLLFIDEVHHAGADTWFKATMELGSYYKFGLTGTAFREDGGTLFLMCVSGKKICNVSTRFLIDNGFLAEPTIYFIDVKVRNMDFPMPYEDVYRRGIIYNTIRNKMVAALVKKHKGQSMLIIFEKLEHGDILFKLIKQIDKDAVLISGVTKGRKQLKEDITAGKIRTVIASRIYNESADIPILEVVINAAGGKSGVQVLQRIGRILRLNQATKKTTATVYDFYDEFNYKLEQHSQKRLSWVKKEQFKIKEVKAVADV